MAKQYVKPEERYEDLNSSAITLIITGILGYAFLILKALDIIPLKFQGATVYMFYIVMGGMFTAFLIFGIKSLRDAKNAKSNISVEAELTQEVLKYFEEECSSVEIDDAIDAAILDEGDLYFKRYDYMTDIMLGKFDIKDEALKEHLLEEAYTILYPEG